jgi:hypothetical protein
MKKYFLFLLLLIITGCSKVAELTTIDKKYIMTYDDFALIKQFEKYKRAKIKDDKNYILKKLNFLDVLSVTYYFAIIDENDQPVMINVSIYKTNDQKKLDNTFNSNKKSNNPNYFKLINFKDFNCSDGFYMDAPFTKNLSIKRNNYIYSIGIVGNSNINLLEYKNIIKDKLDNIEL